MKICFLIPDGVGIRNYLYSDIIGILTQRGHQVVIWHSLDPEVIAQAKRLHPSVHFEQYAFSFYKESTLPRFLRDCVSYARLRVNASMMNNPTILDNWLPKKNLKGKISNRLAEQWGKTMKTRDQIQAIESLIEKRNLKSDAVRKYKADLKKIAPDLVFCTHQREPNAALAMLAAKSLGIHTVTAIFSWDNLPKGRLPVRSDQYLVWSEYMKEELKTYFPSIAERQIHITGTPQFDFYTDQNLLKSRKEFAEQWGLDETKKWVCFSGDDHLTSPFDHIYLRDLAQELVEEKDIQIIFRPVPVEGHERYQEVLDTFPRIKLIRPIWKKGDLWSRFFPFPEDIELLVNLVQHCATVINVGSTMALDFTQFDHPGIFVNYEVNTEHPWSIKRVYQFQHFRTFSDLDAVVWIDSKEEIREKVLQAIQTPNLVATQRQEWKNRIIDQRENETASHRIAEFLESI
ncbi:glycosyltransferase family protein [Algoriphagus namhaensis]